MESEEPAEQRESRFAAFRRRIALLVFRIQSASAMAYMGAASLIGIEAAALVIGFTTVLPVAVPFVVLAMGGAYFFRESLRTAWARLRGRADSEPSETTEDRDVP